jgi:hypothetical protein
MSNYDHLPTEATNEQITQLESIVGSSEPPKPEKPSLFSPAALCSTACKTRTKNAPTRRPSSSRLKRPGSRVQRMVSENESMKAQLTLCQAMLQEIAIRRIDQQIKQIADQLPNNGTLH